MEVIYLVVRTDHASVYHRTTQFLPGLAERGIQSTIAPLPSGLRERRALFAGLAAFDLVILQRKLFNWMNFRPLRRCASRLAYDLDDALFLRDSKSPNPFSWTRMRRFRRTARLADLVICGNDWILERTRPLNERAACIPTVIDTAVYDRVQARPPEDGFRAAWIGSRSTLFYLERLLPVLESLVPLIPGFRLRVIADRFPASRTLPIECVPWSRETEVLSLKECHAGLMPLLEDDWSEGKCGLKLLQYGAAGIPSVCTPTGVNRRIVEDRESGFHARGPEEWKEALLRLARSRELRERLGRRARRIVEERYALSALLDPYAALLRDAAHPVDRRIQG